jgi:hypothetical protein
MSAAAIPTRFSMALAPLAAATLEPSLVLMRQFGRGDLIMIISATF